MRRQRGARDLDHGAELVRDLGLQLGEHLLDHPLHRFAGALQLGHVADQRDHDLRVHLDVLLLERDGGLEDGAYLHLDDLGEEQPQTDAAQPEHRVLLAHALDRVEQGLFRLELLLRRLLQAHGGDLDQLLVVVRQELVQRRVDQADDDRQAVHLFEDADEI